MEEIVKARKLLFKGIGGILAIIVLVLPLTSFASKAAIIPPDNKLKEVVKEATILQDKQVLKTKNNINKRSRDSKTATVVEDITDKKNKTARDNSCQDDCSRKEAESRIIPSLGVFINDILDVFLVLVLWIASPIGVLFLLAARTLFSRDTSSLGRMVAWISQGIAFLLWVSVMSLLLIVYLDSISLRVFGLGGSALNLAISSGFAFAITMLLVVFFERKR